MTDAPVRLVIIESPFAGTSPWRLVAWLQRHNRMEEHHGSVV